VDFGLTEEQTAVRDRCREFAREVVAPAAEELDREHRFGYEIVRQMGEMGLFGLPFPEEYGGSGGDFLSYCLALEGIARADAPVAITLEAAGSRGIRPSVSFGNREQKQRWVAELRVGETAWGLGRTRPAAGRCWCWATSR